MLAVLVSGLGVSPFTNQAVDPATLQANHTAGKASHKKEPVKEQTGADRVAARRAEHEKMKAQREAEAAERLAGKERLKAAGKIDPKHFVEVCQQVVQGSRTHDFDSFEYNGPVSDREVVFNLGAYKTGSTSFDAAATKHMAERSTRSLRWDSGWNRSHAK